MSNLTSYPAYLDHDGEAWIGDDFDLDEPWRETFADEEQRAELMEAWIDYGASDEYAACCGFESA